MCLCFCLILTTQPTYLYDLVSILSLVALAFLLSSPVLGQKLFSDHTTIHEMKLMTSTMPSSVRLTVTGHWKDL